MAELPRAGEGTGEGAGEGKRGDRVYGDFGEDDWTTKGTAWPKEKESREEDGETMATWLGREGEIDKIGPMPTSHSLPDNESALREVRTDIGCCCCCC